MNLVKELVFRFIEHAILGYDFVNDSYFLFHILLCDIDTDPLHGKIFVMYFGHRFPLTSHIRGHLLYYEMSLLHPSNDSSLSLHERKLWIEVTTTL